MANVLRQEMDKQGQAGRKQRDSEGERNFSEVVRGKEAVSDLRVGQQLPCAFRIPASFFWRR